MPEDHCLLAIPTCEITNKLNTFKNIDYLNI